MRKSIGYFTIATLVAGFSAAAPAKPVPDLPSAISYQYALADTSATVALDVTITACSPHPILKIEAQPTIAPVASAKRYTLTGKGLTSWWVSHDLSLTSFDNGTLKTVNSADANKVFSVVTSIFKGVASILSFAGSPSSGDFTCSTNVTEPLKTVASLNQAIKDLRDKLPTLRGKEATDAAAAIDLYAAQMATITTKAPLHFTLKAKTVPLDMHNGYIVWSVDDIPSSSLNGVGADDFRLGFCLGEQTSSDPTATCEKTEIDTAIAMSGSLRADQVDPRRIIIVPPPETCGRDADCSGTIVVREPKRATLTLIAAGSAFGGGNNKILKAVSLPVGQWGAYTFISTNVGLGKSRTVNFSFDAYGAKTSFSFKSDARADSIASGLAGNLDSAASLKSKIDGQALADQKAVVDELTTQQKYNQLIKCKAILDAGGFTCPTS